MASKPAEQVLKDAEDVLERAHREYQNPANSELAQEFYELRLQAAIFNYDVCRDIVGLVVIPSSGLAENMVLKSIIHKLYEFEAALSGQITKRIIDLAEKRCIGDVKAEIKCRKKAIREHLNKLARWKDLRNSATGHYGADIGEQIGHIASLNRAAVEEVAYEFIAYDLFLNKLLRDIGRGSRA